MSFHERPVGRPVLVANGLVKRYGSTTALDGAGLVVHRGEAVAVMGASGSGKTTLLHCLAAIIAPTRAPSDSTTKTGTSRSPG